MFHVGSEKGTAEQGNHNQNGGCKNTRASSPMKWRPLARLFMTRAGTDCAGHAVRAATEADPQATVLSIDGVGAYDHVHLSAMMAKLLEIPSLRGLREAYFRNI